MSLIQQIDAEARAKQAEMAGVPEVPAEKKYLLQSNGHSEEYSTGRGWVKIEVGTPYEATLEEASTLLMCCGVSLVYPSDAVDFPHVFEPEKIDELSKQSPTLLAYGGKGLTLDDLRSHARPNYNLQAQPLEPKAEAPKEETPEDPKTPEELPNADPPEENAGQDGQTAQVNEDKDLKNESFMAKVGRAFSGNG